MNRNDLEYFSKFMLPEDEQKKLEDEALNRLKEDKGFYKEVLAVSDDENEIKKYLPLLETVEQERKECSACKGYAYCPHHESKGLISELYNGGRLTFQTRLISCKYRKEIDKVYKSLVYTDYPKYSVYLFSNEVISYFKKKGKKALPHTFNAVGRKAFERLAKYTPNDFNKGLYIRSLNENGNKLGVALAFNFARKGIRSALIDAGVLFKDMVSRDEDIKARSQRLFTSLIETDFIAVINLGKEYPSSSFRDEVLIPFLSTRLAKGKMTYFSSVYPIKSYAHRYAYRDLESENTLAELLSNLAEEESISDLNW